MTTNVNPTPINSGVNAKPLSKMISELAVVACVQASSLGLNKLDKRASEESDAQHNAKEGASRVNVNRLPGAKAAVDAIKQKQTAARNLVKSKTTLWGVDRRLLMNQFIGEVAGEFQDIKNEHDALVGQFVQNAAYYISQASSDLGTYDIRPPTEAEIAGAFDLRFDLAPVPDVSAYTTGDSALEQSMRQRFEADIKAAYEGAQNDLLKRLAEPLENLVDRMKAYDEREYLKSKDIDVGKTGTFKSTVITNITDIAKIFRAFNINGDAFLAEIADRLEAFEGIEHKDLTKSPDLRKDTAIRAAEIRGLLKDWL
jgi:hypothetical protein